MFSLGELSGSTGRFQSEGKSMQERGVLPTPVVVGCILDGLVCNGEVEQGVDLLDEWKKEQPPNALMFVWQVLQRL